MDTQTKARTVFGMALGNWTALLCFEMLYKTMGISFFFPFLQTALRLLPKLAGERYLGQENILKLLRCPPALLLLGGLYLLAGIFIYFEITALILYSEKGWRRERSTVLGLWKDALIKAAGLLRLKRLPVFLFLPVMTLSAFAMTSGYLRIIQIPEFITDYLAGSRPLFLLFAAGILLFHLLFFLYLFGLPAILLDGMTFRASWRESIRLLKGRTWRTAGVLLKNFFLFSLVLLVFKAAGICLLAVSARLFQGAEAGRTQFRLDFLAWSGVWRLAAGTMLSVFLCALIVALYHRYRGDARPEADRQSRTPRQLFGRAAAVVCTLALLLLFGESEAGGRVWYPAELTTKVVAHRGGAAFAPENTVAALEQAIKDGADMAEIDVRQLRDGTLVVMHDNNFKRTTGVDLSVQNAVYKQVKHLDAGSHFSSKFSGEPVPTLEEMLAAAKGRIQLMIELKPSGHEQPMAEAVLALIRKHDMLEQCVIASMSLDLLGRVKELEPDMRTAYISVLLLSKEYDLEALDAYSVEATSLTRELVVEAHFQGKQVYAWTANTQNTIQKILSRQADGIVTDNPQLANFYLDTMEENFLLNSASDLFFPEAVSLG